MPPGREPPDGRLGCRDRVRSPIVQTRYLILAALATALVILAASFVWFLRVAS